MVKVKSVGALRHAAGTEEISIQHAEELSVENLMFKLAKEKTLLKNSLVDERFGQMYLNVLVLVNGREINVLNGVKTMLKENDEVVFIPVVHGG
jgi:molybdopterin converting factor small subunit